MSYLKLKEKNNAYQSILILNQYEMNYPAFRRDTLIQIVKGKMVQELSSNNRISQDKLSAYKERFACK